MELKLILLTHAHFDHTGGVAELCAALPRVPVYLHPADAALVGATCSPPSARRRRPIRTGTW
ncbi:MBL fold metallo-hydrolase [Flavonifractor plautii]|nr:MBL fold metallo-hydrolase [Flavonifractor plautii]